MALAALGTWRTVTHPEDMIREAGQTRVRRLKPCWARRGGCTGSGATARVGAIVKALDEEATNPARLKAMGIEVLLRDLARQDSRAVVVQVIAHGGV